MAETEPEAVAEMRRRSFPMQAATFSLLAPLLVLVVGMLNITGAIQMPAARIWLGLVNLGLLVCGLGLGIAALICRGKQPVRGVVSRAVLGIVLNGLLLTITSVAILYGATTARRAKTHRKREATEAEEEGKDSFLNYPGWLGSAQHAGAQITVASLPPNSPFARGTMGSFTVRFQILNFSIQNHQSDEPIVLGPESVRLHLADGSVRTVLPHRETLAKAREKPDEWVTRYGGPYRVPPGVALMDAPVFVPPDLDFTQVTSVSARVNGETVVLEGRHYTAAEKQELLRVAQERQTARPATSQAPPAQGSEGP